MTEYTLYVDFHLIYFLEYAFLDDFMLCPADCNPAVLQRNDIVGIARGKVDVMDDDDDRLILLTHESPQNLHDLHRVLHIKVVERLIQEDILRILDDCHRNVCSLPLSAGQLIDVAVLEYPEFHIFYRFIDDPVVLILQAALGVWVAAETDQFAHRDFQLKMVRLLKYGYPFGKRIVRLSKDVVAFDQHFAAVFIEQSGDH